MVGLRTIFSSGLAAGALLLATGCGGPSRAERALSEKDSWIRRMEQDRTEALQREEQLHKQNALLGEQNKKLAEQNSQMANKNAALAVSTKQKVESLSAQITALGKKLATQKRSVSVAESSKEPGAITIRVANTVLFDAGRATLKPSAHKTLREVARTLKSKYPKNYVRIEGHTDRTPLVRPSTRKMFKDNMGLSQARAKAVFDFLSHQAKMPARMMYTAGYGYSQPVVWPEKTRADRAKNRRVDIVILPNHIKIEKKALKTASNR